MKSDAKISRYREVQGTLNRLLSSDTPVITKMATFNCILKEVFDFYFWVGFYMVHPKKQNCLTVGPYQGTLGCLSIPFGRGVCGVAAQQKQTQIVPDVHKFSGHIACDSASNSEIVVPVFDNNQTLIAVFDVDSTEFAAFDDVDRAWLEILLKEHFGK